MKLNKTVLDIALEEKRAAIEKSFKDEWGVMDFKLVRGAIARHFNGRALKTSHGDILQNHVSFGWWASKLGLPYTSSSSYAGLWVTNTEVYCEKYPGYKYEGFALSESGIVYAILWDKEENEILMPL